MKRILRAVILINQLKQIEIDDLKFELYKDNHIKSYDDKLISLLVNFHNIPEKFEFALDLLIKYGLWYFLCFFTINQSMAFQPFLKYSDLSEL